MSLGILSQPIAFYMLHSIFRTSCRTRSKQGPGTISETPKTEMYRWPAFRLTLIHFFQLRLGNGTNWITEPNRVPPRTLSNETIWKRSQDLRQTLCSTRAPEQTRSSTPSWDSDVVHSTLTYTTSYTYLIVRCAHAGCQCPKLPNTFFFGALSITKYAKPWGRASRHLILRATI